MEPTKKYIEENKDRFLEELFGLISIPSISPIADHKPDMLKAANYWKDSMLKAGCDRADVLPTDGNPVVFGEKIIDLVYRGSKGALAGERGYSLTFYYVPTPALQLINENSSHLTITSNMLNSTFLQGQYQRH